MNSLIRQYPQQKLQGVLHTHHSSLFLFKSVFVLTHTTVLQHTIIPMKREHAQGGGGRGAAAPRYLALAPRAARAAVKRTGLNTGRSMEMTWRADNTQTSQETVLLVCVKAVRGLILERDRRPVLTF